LSVVPDHLGHDTQQPTFPAAVEDGPTLAVERGGTAGPPVPARQVAARRADRRLGLAVRAPQANIRLAEESAGFSEPSRYAVGMSNDVEATRARTPLRKRMQASLVLVAAGALAVWLFIGVIKTIFFIVAGIAIVVAVLWALKTIR